RRVVVMPVEFRVRRRHPRVVERHDARGDERAVVPVGDDHDPENRDDEIQGMHETDSIAILERVSPSRRLLAYALRYRRQFVLGLVCVAVSRAIALAAPAVLGYAID